MTVDTMSLREGGAIEPVFCPRQLSSDEATFGLVVSAKLLNTCQARIVRYF